jgi:WD40 repeat protein
LSVCANDRRTIAASDGQGISVLSLDGEVVAALPAGATGGDPIGALYLSRDGARLAALGPRQLTIWDVDARKPLQEISLQRTPVLGLFNADGSKFALNFGDDVDILDIASGKITSLDLPPGSANTLLVPNDPDLLVTASMLASPSTADKPLDARHFVTGNLSVWDARTGKLVRAIETDDPLFTASISDDGGHIATSTRLNALTVWTIEE